MLTPPNPCLAATSTSLGLPLQGRNFPKFEGMPALLGLLWIAIRIRCLSFCSIFAAPTPSPPRERYPKWIQVGDLLQLNDLRGHEASPVPPSWNGHNLGPSWRLKAGILEAWGEEKGKRNISIASNVSFLSLAGTESQVVRDSWVGFIPSLQFWEAGVIGEDSVDSVMLLAQTCQGPTLFND